MGGPAGGNFFKVGHMGKYFGMDKPTYSDGGDCGQADNWVLFEMRVEDTVVMSEEAEGFIAQFGAVLSRIGGWLPIFGGMYYFVFNSKQPVKRLDEDVTWRWAKRPALTEPVERN